MLLNWKKTLIVEISGAAGHLANRDPSYRNFGAVRKGVDIPQILFIHEFCFLRFMILHSLLQSEKFLQLC